jgi:hypothetical protein
MVLPIGSLFLYIRVALEICLLVLLVDPHVAMTAGEGIALGIHIKGGGLTIIFVKD